MHFKMSSAICFNLDLSKILSSGNRLRINGAVHGHEIQRWPRNPRIPSSIPESRCQLGFSLAHTFSIQHENWCSSQEAELREIRISCKNLLLKQCKINMFNPLPDDKV